MCRDRSAVGNAARSDTANQTDAADGNAAAARHPAAVADAAGERVAAHDVDVDVTRRYRVGIAHAAGKGGNIGDENSGNASRDRTGVSNAVAE